MNAEEMLHFFSHGRVQVIERVINVDYDNQRQLPLSFVYEKRRRYVIKLISTYKGDLSPDDLNFFVETDNGEIYVLYLHLCNTGSQGQFCKSFWVLSRRVLWDDLTKNPVLDVKNN